MAELLWCTFNFAKCKSLWLGSSGLDPGSVLAPDTTGKIYEWAHTKCDQGRGNTFWMKPTIPQQDKPPET